MSSRTIASQAIDAGFGNGREAASIGAQAVGMRSLGRSLATIALELGITQHHLRECIAIAEWSAQWPLLWDQIQHLPSGRVRPLLQLKVSALDAREGEWDALFDLVRIQEVSLPGLRQMVRDNDVWLAEVPHLQDDPDEEPDEPSTGDELQDILDELDAAERFPRMRLTFTEVEEMPGEPAKADIPDAEAFSWYLEHEPVRRYLAALARRGEPGADSALSLHEAHLEQSWQALRLLERVQLIGQLSAPITRSPAA